MPLQLPQLPFWMDGERTGKLAKAAHRWFDQLGKASLWFAENLDPRTCPEEVLDLLAWQRGISRYPNEPDRLYRLRIYYAYPNGVDAGGINGWKRIFARLELGQIELEERMQGQDWDIINLVIDDTTFPDQQSVLEIIINEYGRTCRRYHIVSRIPQAVKIRANTFDDDHNTVLAMQGQNIGTKCTASLGFFDFNHETMEAKWA